MEKDTPSNVLLVLFELLLSVVVNAGRLISILFIAVYRALWRQQESSDTLENNQKFSTSVKD
jgi:hypothetical protein